MKRAEHVAASIKAFGEGFEEVHKWLDGCAVVDGKLNLNHRRWRHHDEGVEEVRKMWGDKAAKAAELHIMQDEGRIPTRQQAEKDYPDRPSLIDFDKLV
jgi:hypothetical protein